MSKTNPDLGQFFETGGLTTTEKEVVLKGYGIGKARRDGRTYKAYELAQLQGTSVAQIRKSEVSALTKLKKSTDLVDYLQAKFDTNNLADEAAVLLSALTSFDEGSQKPILFTEEDSGDAGADERGDNPGVDVPAGDSGTATGSDVGTGGPREEPIGEVPAVDIQAPVDHRANEHVDGGVLSGNQIRVSPVYGLTSKEFDTLLQDVLNSSARKAMVTGIVYNKVRSRSEISAIVFDNVSIVPCLTPTRGGAGIKVRTLSGTNFAAFCEAIQKYLSSPEVAEINDSGVKEITVNFMPIFVSSFQRTEYSILITHK